MMRLGCRGAVMRPLQWSYRAPLQRAYSEEPRMSATLRTPKIEALGKQILELQMLEVAELQAFLAEKMGVNMSSFNAGPAVAAPAASAPAAAAPAAKEAEPAPAKAAAKDTFTIKLTAIAEGKKFPVLKILRKVAPNMNLMESKKLVEELPSTVAENVPAADANKYLAELAEAGATAQLV